MSELSASLKALPPGTLPENVIEGLKIATYPIDDDNWFKGCDLVNAADLDTAVAGNILRQVRSERTIGQKVNNIWFYRVSDSGAILDAITDPVRIEEAKKRLARFRAIATLQKRLPPATPVSVAEVPSKPLLDILHEGFDASIKVEPLTRLSNGWNTYLLTFYGSQQIRFAKRSADDAIFVCIVDLMNALRHPHPARSRYRLSRLDWIKTEDRVEIWFRNLRGLAPGGLTSVPISYYRQFRGYAVLREAMREPEFGTILDYIFNIKLPAMTLAEPRPRTVTPKIVVPVSSMSSDEMPDLKVIKKAVRVVLENQRALNTEFRRMSEKPVKAPNPFFHPILAFRHWRESRKAVSA